MKKNKYKDPTLIAPPKGSGRVGSRKGKGINSGAVSATEDDSHDENHYNIENLDLDDSYEDDDFNIYFDKAQLI